MCSSRCQTEQRRTRIRCSESHRYTDSYTTYQPPPGPDAYLAQQLDVTAAWLFADLMAPEFILVRGCVIRRAAYSPSNFDLWWSSEKGDVVSVERASNHLHLWDIFSRPDLPKSVRLNHWDGA
jgi:hypothetical protein